MVAVAPRREDRSDETIVTIKTIVMATINTRPRRRIGRNGRIGLNKTTLCRLGRRPYPQYPTSEAYPLIPNNAEILRLRFAPLRMTQRVAVRAEQKNGGRLKKSASILSGGLASYNSTTQLSRNPKRGTEPWGTTCWHRGG